MTLHVWKAAVLTAMVPLGLVACQGSSSPPSPQDAKAPSTQQDRPSPAKLDLGAQAAEPPVPGDAAPPTDPKPDPKLEPEPSEETGNGENTKPDGTQTPIVVEPRPARKYGAPPRPATKYGGPPKPRK